MDGVTGGGPFHDTAISCHVAVKPLSATASHFLPRQIVDAMSSLLEWRGMDSQKEDFNRDLYGSASLTIRGALDSLRVLADSETMRHFQAIEKFTAGLQNPAQAPPGQAGAAIRRAVQTLIRPRIPRDQMTRDLRSAFQDSDMFNSWLNNSVQSAQGTTEFLTIAKLKFVVQHFSSWVESHCRAHFAQECKDPTRPTRVNAIPLPPQVEAKINQAGQPGTTMLPAYAGIFAVGVVSFLAAPAAVLGPIPFGFLGCAEIPNSAAGAVPLNA